MAMSVKWSNDGDQRPTGINWYLLACLAFISAFWTLFAYQITGGR